MTTRNRHATSTRPARTRSAPGPAAENAQAPLTVPSRPGPHARVGQVTEANGAPMSTDPVVDHTYTVPEAAALCGCSIDTVRRHLRDRRFPRAFQDGDVSNAAWRIPLPDLVSAGLYQPGPVEPEPPTEPTPVASAEGSTELAARLQHAERTIEQLLQQNQHLLQLLERTLGAPDQSAQAAVRRVS